MTIEKLLDLPPEGLEAIPDAELEAMLAPYFKFTRPESPIATIVKGSVMTPGNTSGRAPRSTPAGSITKSSAKAMLELALNTDNMTPEKMKLLKEMMHSR